jgi:hypothetical protein
MSASFFRLIYTLLPCLVGAYAVAVFLTTRPLLAARAWTLGLLIALILTFGVSAVVSPHFGLPLTDRSMLMSYGSLYVIPTIVLVGAAIGLRTHGVARSSGIVVLVALFLAAAWAGRYAAFYYLNIGPIIR